MQGRVKKGVEAPRSQGLDLGHSSNDTIMGAWTFQSPGYDTLNRLVSGNATSGPYSGEYGCWGYDAFGNRIMQLFQTAACPSPPTPGQTPSTVYYNSNNQVTFVSQSAPSTLSAPTGFSYGAAGNVIADNANTYLYDGESRICGVKSEPIPGTFTMTGYLYDANGARVAKGTIANMNSCDPIANGFQLTESYVLGQGGEELTMLGVSSSPWQRTNVYGAGKLLATYDTNGLHFHLTDPLGTRRMQVSAQGVPETDIQSLPFGDGLFPFPDINAPETADDATPLHFTGKERDTESGNDYFEARYYASSMGRFMSPDWSSIPVGVPYASIGDPQSLNLYAYVGNNPLSHRDLDGHHQECAPDTSSTGKDGSITVTAGACHEVPDWWQFQGARRWLGQHPKTVKTVGAVVIGATAISGVFDAGASELAVPEEIAAEEALIEAGEVAAEEAGQSAATANKIVHIFDNAEHGLDGVVKASGGKAEAFQALQKATTEATQGVSGQFEKVVSVAGQNVTVRGVVMNGVAKIGTAFIPK